MPREALRRAEEAYRRGALAEAERLLGTSRSGDAEHLRGLIAHQRGAHTAAVAHLLEALSCRGDPLWRANLGIVYLSAGDSHRAAAQLRRAIAASPGLVSAHSNLSAALLALDQPQAALSAAATAISLDAEMPEAYNNFGAALQLLGRLEDARAAFQAAIDHSPGDADYTCNLGILDLMEGHTALGWARYESRELEAREPPRWQGAPLGGRPLLLYAEQGLGDTLQFCRYAAALSSRGVAVWLEAPRVLWPLLSSLGDAIRLVSKEEGASAYRSVPLMSLPHLLGPREADYPSAVPYLWPEPDRVARWRERLPPGRVRIGVSWQGNLSALADVGRSFRLRDLSDVLGDIDGVTLISVQRGAGEEQLSDVASVHRLSGLDAAGGFRDTAAVMSQLDLVISADTATAHLAGALGRRVWVALRHSPDWRWQMQRSDSPWYPTARLFRQPQHGEWGPVFAAMRDALNTFKK